MNRKTKIVADSSADLLAFDGVPYESVPLKIITADREFVDDKNLDIREMLVYLADYRGKSSSSCPNTSDWLGAFGDADWVFCVTITSGLSGSYNSACVAKSAYEEEYQDRRVCVIDSLSAGPELKLIIEKLREYIEAEMDFDEIATKIKDYQKTTGLLFMLESMKNLANNGRVKPIVAKAAGLLGIRVIGKASDVGQLEQLSKCRGESRALDTIVKYIKELGTIAGKIRIAHCENKGAALELKRRILNECSTAKIEIYPCRALCSFYAERGGMLVGFEK